MALSLFFCGLLVIYELFYGNEALSASDVKEEVHHVAVLDDMLFSFGAEPASALELHLALMLFEVLDPVGLGEDEAPLEVAVDHPRDLRRATTGRDRPGADLLLSCGEVGLEAKEPVGLAGQYPPERANSFGLFCRVP